MRRAARVDNNHREIARALIDYGCAVADTSGAGSGFPDLVVGFRGKNFLLEIKNPEKSPAQKALTPSQIDFRDGWHGQYDVIETLEEAIAVVTETR